MENRVITAHIPVDLAEKIDEIAERLERPRGWILKQALLGWIELEEERRQLTLDALDEVDQGKTLSHADVQAWAQSLGSDHPIDPPHFTP